ncbi:MAG: hypothetical protein U0X92_00700 [Anaerolineales bacterium]
MIVEKFCPLADLQKVAQRVPASFREFYQVVCSSGSETEKSDQRLVLQELRINARSLPKRQDERATALHSRQYKFDADLGCVHATCLIIFRDSRNAFFASSNDSISNAFFWVSQRSARDPRQPLWTL